LLGRDLYSHRRPFRRSEAHQRPVRALPLTHRQPRHPAPPVSSQAAPARSCLTDPTQTTCVSSFLRPLPSPDPARLSDNPRPRAPDGGHSVAARPAPVRPARCRWPTASRAIRLRTCRPELPCPSGPTDPTLSVYVSSFPRPLRSILCESISPWQPSSWLQPNVTTGPLPAVQGFLVPPRDQPILIDCLPPAAPSP